MIIQHQSCMPPIQAGTYWLPGCLPSMASLYQHKIINILSALHATNIDSYHPCHRPAGQPGKGPHVCTGSHEWNDEVTSCPHGFHSTCECAGRLQGVPKLTGESFLRGVSLLGKPSREKNQLKFQFCQNYLDLDLKVSLRLSPDNRTWVPNV